MKVLVTGGGGQVATALQTTAPPGTRLQVLSRSQLDVTDFNAVYRLIEREKPQVVINTAAYTAVDRAESEPEQAFAVNADGAGHVASAVQKAAAQLVQLSTDFVFDGKQSMPYLPTDTPKPLGVYGASKLAGERLVLQTMPTALVLRTAWIYAESGRNFVHTVLRLCAEKPELKIVMDQMGSPTWASSIAHAVWKAVERRIEGLHHWVDGGVASWYEFAVAIQEEALALGLLVRPVPIHPIRTVDYPTLARRPAYSMLDVSSFTAATGLIPTHWRDNLRQTLRNMKHG